MAFLTSDNDICKLSEQAKQEALVWHKDYPEFQRLADNDLINDLDESLPEVNDGTLSASLFKLPKRIVNTDLKGRAKATDRDDAWVTELANIVWEEQIIPNANSQAPFHRKWKDAVRKAAIYGSVPLITLFTSRGKYTGSDFIVAQPQDVLLEPGKVSDYDSNVFFWEVFYSKLDLENMLERAKDEQEDSKNSETDGYNKWNIPGLEKLIKEYPEEERTSTNDKQNGDPKIKGVKFTVVFQRGVGAPFYMYHMGSGDKIRIREWTNPDPSGDVPVHFLYCYQDFENPYGIGIVKLAGGTQNVLDYMRQADVLATQLGLRPPISIAGVNIEGLDEDSIIYAQDAIWRTGNAQVKREELNNNIYSQLPSRQSMYKISLNQMIPTGDTSISSGAGDQDYSKTPAGVKFQQANLSIDDEDFKDNFYITYEAKARSLINTHFANMEGHDIVKLSDEHRDILQQAGLEFPVDAEGNPTNELDIIWDEARAEFVFEIDAEQDKAKDDEKRLEGLLKVAEFRASDPMFDQKLMASGKKINDGELFASIIQLTTDNDKILEDITPEDEQAQAEDEAMQAGLMQEGQEPPTQPGDPMEQPMGAVEAPQAEGSDLLQQIMQRFGVDQQAAQFMLTAEQQGYSPDEIFAALERQGVPVNG